MKNHKKILIECYEEYCKWYVKAQIETNEEDKIYDNNIIIKREVEPKYFHDVEEFIRKTIKQWCKLEEKRIEVEEDETSNM